MLNCLIVKMLQLRSIVNVADNSGAKKVGVFKVLGGSKKRYARIGDMVVISVKVAEPRKAVKKKDVLRAVVERKKMDSCRQSRLVNLTT